MRGTKNKCKEQLTDTQVQEKIGNILARPQKISDLTAAVFVISFLALTLGIAVPPTFKKTGAFWGKILWTINLIWTLVVALRWKTLLPQELKRLSKKQKRCHLRLETIWFHIWKGGYIALTSLAILLISLGMLSVLGSIGWVSGLAVGGYLLTFVLSFWQRRRILRVVVEGWSADTRWGWSMLRLAATGPAVGASVGSSIGILLVRLHVLPKNALSVFAGLLGILVGDMMVPQVVQDFSVAWIHLQVSKAAELEMGED